MMRYRIFFKVKKKKILKNCYILIIVLTGKISGVWVIDKFQWDH